MKNQEQNSDFTPQWLETEPKENSFRSIFKWGEKQAFKNPSQGFLKVIKQELKLTDADFQRMENTGNQTIDEIGRASCRERV